MKFRPAVIAVGAVFALHLAGMYFHWYFAWREFDIVMHFLGGLSMGLVGISLLYNGSADKLYYWQKLLFVLGFVALVGIFWEFLEFGVDRGQLIGGGRWEDLTLRDTLADLMNDLVGGLIAYIFFIKK